MAALKNEILHLIMQYLGDEKYKETLHTLEAESKLYFDIKYFQELILKGNWDEADKYFSSFTRIDDHPISMKVLYKIRNNNYLEALGRSDITKAINLLNNELKPFKNCCDNINSREQIKFLMKKKSREQQSQLTTTTTTIVAEARAALVAEFKSLLMAHPMIENRMNRPRFMIENRMNRPQIEGERLKSHINNSLNLQHMCCSNKTAREKDFTLYEDHEHLYDYQQPSSNNLLMPDQLNVIEKNRTINLFDEVPKLLIKNNSRVQSQITTDTNPSEATRVALAPEFKSLFMSDPMMEERMHLPPSI